jgi:hypothetical protein
VNGEFPYDRFAKSTVCSELSLMFVDGYVFFPSAFFNLALGDGYLARTDCDESQVGDVAGT